MVESEDDVVVMVFSGRYGVPFVYEHCSVVSIRLGRLFLLRERKRYRFGGSSIRWRVLPMLVFLPSNYYRPGLYDLS